MNRRLVDSDDRRTGREEALNCDNESDVTGGVHRLRRAEGGDAETGAILHHRDQVAGNEPGAGDRDRLPIGQVLIRQDRDRRSRRGRSVFPTPHPLVGILTLAPPRSKTREVTDLRNADIGRQRRSIIPTA